MTFLNRAYAAIKAAVIAYPGGVTAVVGIIVALAARFGFHVTITELMTTYAIASAAVGTFVHYAVKAAVKGAVTKERHTTDGL